MIEPPGPLGPLAGAGVQESQGAIRVDEQQGCHDRQRPPRIPQRRQFPGEPHLPRHLRRRRIPKLQPAVAPCRHGHRGRRRGVAAADGRALRHLVRPHRRRVGRGPSRAPTTTTLPTTAGPTRAASRASRCCRCRASRRRSRSCGALWASLASWQGSFARTPSFTAIYTTGRTTRSTPRRWSSACRSWSAARLGACCRNSGADRYADDRFSHEAVSTTYELWVAMMSLFSHNVLERFPGLNVGFLGAGAKLAAVLDRAARGALGRDPLRTRLPEHAAAGLRLPAAGVRGDGAVGDGHSRASCTRLATRPLCGGASTRGRRCPRSPTSSTPS